MSLSKYNLLSCLAMWLLVVGIGTWKMLSFDFAAGDAGLPVSQWPSDSTLVRSEVLPTLVVFIHPKCPCSNATANELERLESKLRIRAKCIVVFSQPVGAPSDWCNTRTAKAFSHIPNIETQIDEGNLEAARFGCIAVGLQRPRTGDTAG